MPVPQQFTRTGGRHGFGSSTSALAESLTLHFSRITSSVTLNGVAYQSCWDVGANHAC